MSYPFHPLLALAERLALLVLATFVGNPADYDTSHLASMERQVPLPKTSAVVGKKYFR